MLYQFIILFIKVFVVGGYAIGSLALTLSGLLFALGYAALLRCQPSLEPESRARFRLPLRLLGAGGAGFLLLILVNIVVLVGLFYTQVVRGPVL